MFDTVSKIGDLLHKLERLNSVTFYGDVENIITKEVVQEIRVKAGEWKRGILKRWNEFFIKQANIRVLYKKKMEILESDE